MKRFVFLALAAAFGGCSTDPGEVRPATVLWMEWPAQVTVGQAYQARFVFTPICENGHLVVREASNDSVVAFDTRWLDVRPAEWGCEPAGPIRFFWTHEAAQMTGPPRILDVEGAGSALGSHRRFGSLTVVANEGADTTRAAGQARFWTEGSGCQRILPSATPIGFPPSPDSYQFAGVPPDTSSFRGFWVEGYFERATTACSRWAGDTLVFHLTSHSVEY